MPPVLFTAQDVDPNRPTYGSVCATDNQCGLCQYCDIPPGAVYGTCDSMPAGSACANGVCGTCNGAGQCENMRLAGTQAGYATCRGAHAADPNACCADCECNGSDPFRHCVNNSCQCSHGPMNSNGQCPSPDGCYPNQCPDGFVCSGGVCYPQNGPETSACPCPYGQTCIDGNCYSVNCYPVCDVGSPKTMNRNGPSYGYRCD